jgi:hypothetical protein
LIAAALAVATFSGCDSQPGDRRAEQSPETPAKAHRPLPRVAFPRELRTEFPEISSFLDEFLGTCLVGDYAGYRRLVSRSFRPETRERFDAIYQAVRGVTVESIEKVDLPRLPPPVYLVVSDVELSAERSARLGESHRRIAILVLKELDRWRMAPAPAALQPADEESTATASAPATTSAPSYPWDEQGDD